MPPHFPHHRLSDEDGFTIVEVLVAAVVLVVGLLGTLILVDTANTTTFQTKAREQATSLQRELIESARAVPYDQLTPTAVASEIQGRPALADGGSSPGWSIERRGETYTVAVGTCIVDDARDGTGQRDPGTFCDPATLGRPASGCQAALDATPSASAPAKVAGNVNATAAAACGIDANLDGVIENLTRPDAAACTGTACDDISADYKRVVTMVRWEQGQERRQILMVTTISNPGMSAAPAITNPSPVGGTLVSDPSTTSVTFSATANPAPATVLWYLDGAPRGEAAASGGTWRWTWTFGPATLGAGPPAAGEVVDGLYIIGAKAFDRFGQSGSLRSTTMTVNRRAPFAVRNLKAGRNGDVVDLTWTPNPERDLEGYRVFRLRDDGGTPVVVCQLTIMDSCQDVSPPERTDPPQNPRYMAVAVDRDPQTGLQRQGHPSNTATAVDDNLPPAPPSGLAATPVDGGLQLTWDAPPRSADDESCDPDKPTGPHICYFNIYRDGILYADRYDRTATGTDLDWTDPDPGLGGHTYYVTAVDRHLAESSKVSVVAP